MIVAQDVELRAGARILMTGATFLSDGPDYRIFTDDSVAEVFGGENQLF